MRRVLDLSTSQLTNWTSNLETADPSGPTASDCSERDLHTTRPAKPSPPGYPNVCDRLIVSASPLVTLAMAPAAAPRVKMV